VPAGGGQRRSPGKGQASGACPFLPKSFPAGQVHMIQTVIMCVESQAIDFRLTRERNTHALPTGREILAGDDYAVERQGGTTLITLNMQTSREGRPKVRWR
jgi:hypothetical protein